MLAIAAPTPKEQIEWNLRGIEMVEQDPSQKRWLAALHNKTLGLTDNWLRHVQDVRTKHQAEIDALNSEAEQQARLCELNVIEQVTHVGQTTVVRDAWWRGQELAVHGWIYDLHDGLIKDLGVSLRGEPPR